jgi:hypothetical protein
MQNYKEGRDLDYKTGQHSPDPESEQIHYEREITISGKDDEEKQDNSVYPITHKIEILQPLNFNEVNNPRDTPHFENVEKMKKDGELKKTKSQKSIKICSDNSECTDNENANSSSRNELLRKLPSMIPSKKEGKNLLSDLNFENMQTV